MVEKVCWQNIKPSRGEFQMLDNYFMVVLAVIELIACLMFTSDFLTFNPGNPSMPLSPFSPLPGSPCSNKQQKRMKKRQDENKQRYVS